MLVRSPQTVEDVERRKGPGRSRVDDDDEFDRRIMASLGTVSVAANSAACAT